MGSVVININNYPLLNCTICQISQIMCLIGFVFLLKKLRLRSVGFVKVEIWLRG